MHEDFPATPPAIRADAARPDAAGDSERTERAAGGRRQNGGRRRPDLFAHVSGPILMTLMTLLPAILLGMTAFTRIIVVLSILRQALGMATTPSNQILTGLALFMTFFIMSTTIEQSYANGIKP